MKRLTFEEMIFSRTSDAWCPITGRAVGANKPRIVDDRILASVVGSALVYYQFGSNQGYVKYSNEVGCYDRVGSTHVFTDELNALEVLLTGVPNFVRGPVGGGFSQDGRSLECFRVGQLSHLNEVFLITTLIHGDEADGILGTIKAFEVLATHPDFALLRDQYTICLMPCCNPDGYYLGQRNLNIDGPHPSGIDAGINLNRVWPWYWTEFVPTDSESKGDAPITCSLESQAMEDWRTQFDGSVPIAWALDQHATAGDGARYISRDRNFRELPEGEYEKFWADWTTYRLLRAIQAKRVHADGMPDLFVNYFRSRWRPHWHSYLATMQAADNGGIQCCSFIGEHNKVPDQIINSDLETYQSASNFNFDHIIALALVAQGGITERKPAVLVEHEVGDNQFQNSDFEAWQPDEYRPGYWSIIRADYIGRKPEYIPSDSIDTRKHMQALGRTIQLTPSLAYELDEGYYGTNGDADIVWASGIQPPAILVARTIIDGLIGVLGVYTWDLDSNPQLLFKDGALMAHEQWRLGDADPETIIYLFCSGNLTDPLDATFVSYALSDGVWTLTTHVTHTTPLIDAGACIDGVGRNLYIFGGRVSAGTWSPKVWKADCTANTFTEVGTDLLVDDDGGMGACFCEHGDLAGMIVLVGGAYDGGLGLKVRVFDPTTESMEVYYVDPGEFDLYDPLKSPSIRYCAVVYDDTDTIWFYGGEHVASGYIYRSVWSITWSGTGFDPVVSHLLDAGLSDDGDPEDYSGDENWIRHFRHWRGLRIDTEDAPLSHILFGGVEEGIDDQDERRGFYGHYFSDNLMARPSEYTYGYLRYNIHFDIDTFTKMNTSWSMRAYDVSTSELHSAYVRINNSTGSSATGEIALRRARTYYMHPPQWWIRDHSVIDFSMAKPSDVEDEVRCYIRGYRQGQTLLIDAPMMQKGTLWPSSWSPYGMVRAIETAFWPGAIDGRFFRIKFDWVPASIFYALDNYEQHLLTLGGESQTIKLYATVAASNVREYARGYLLGPTEPCLELHKYDGESYTSCAIPIYWGGHLKDSVASRFDSSIQIEIWHHPMYGIGMVIRNGWSEGWVKLPIRFLPSLWPSNGDVTIHGGGWWGEPEMLEMDITWKCQVNRSDFEQGALLLGDRDPTYGQVSAQGAFRYTETFTRANDSNLGSNWNIIVQTGSGFNIVNNQARCEGRGIERWCAYPYIRDCSIIASVSATNGNKVGLCTRLHWGMCSDGWVHGYVGYLYCTGVATADLVIERHFYDEGIQSLVNLASTSIVYLAGSMITLALEVSNTSITLTASDGATGVVSALDSNHSAPGAFGIYGETTGLGSYVYVDSVHAETEMKTRITE
jgi:hypothetical protein